MSWWVSLEDHNQNPWCSYGTSKPDACPEPCYPIVEVESFREGGTQVVGGSTTAHLNITYNYGTFYSKYLDDKDGLRWLNGKTGKKALPRLINAVDQLGTNKDSDYWTPTSGNAGIALALLAKWAKANPNAIFRVS